MKPTVTCSKNGPYIVDGLQNFTDAKGISIPAKAKIALCRCGASKNKPFCDGTHSKIGFSDEKLPGRNPDKRDNYDGKDITIHDNRGICSHAGYCTDGIPSVWRMKTEPWIDPDGADPKAIIDTIHKCPSGALAYSVDDIEHLDQDREPTIQVTKDGPFYVTGGVDIQVTERADGVSREHCALCRCGGSKNKPFCDGTHWYNEFKDDADTGETQVSAASDTNASTQLNWYRVAGLDDFADGDVRAVSAGTTTIALTRTDGKYAALDNTCPHQGGPLGEGSIENGVLRCPWHGWDFDPTTGCSKDGNSDGVTTYQCEVRDDGIYVAVEETVEHIRTVSDVMVETMVNWGVRHVFGMVGHSNLGLSDAIRLQEEKGNLKFIGVRHEGAAAFACSGYAKLTGKPAACLGIAGPGSTNLLTGLWDAKVDRAPVLALSGQISTQVVGPGAFQEIDLASAFRAVSRFSQTVLHTSNHAELMTLALKTAIVERDVGHLIFPDEVQVQPVADEIPSSGPSGRIGSTGITPPAKSLSDAVARIASAKRPLIIVGYGAANGMDDIIQLAERLNAPILTTFKAKGLISDAHPLAGGVLGRSGTPIASWFMNESDLLIVLGASFANHTGIDRTKDIIQVDHDRMALGKFHPVAVPVWGDIGITTRLICDQIRDDYSSTGQRSEIAERWALWRAEKDKRALQDRGNGINSASVFATLTQLIPANAVIAVDVGNNTYSFGRYFECRNQSVLMSGYLAAIGFGFPAAMGAWAAAPDRPIFSISGDGGFGQYMAEFTTAVKYGMNITHILLNNNELGKISKEQRAGQWPVWQTSLHNPNFSEYAKLCGGFGVRVIDRTELESAITRALEFDGPALVEILTDAELI